MVAGERRLRLVGRVDGPGRVASDDPEFAFWYRLATIATAELIQFPRDDPRFDDLQAYADDLRQAVGLPLRESSCGNVRSRRGQGRV